MEVGGAVGRVWRTKTGRERRKQQKCGDEGKQMWRKPAAREGYPLPSLLKRRKRGRGMRKSWHQMIHYSVEERGREKERGKCGKDKQQQW